MLKIRKNVFETNSSSTHCLVIKKDKLDLDINEQKKWNESRIAFNMIRYLIEKVGVLVFEIDKVDIQEMRGFAIAEKIMPVIAINRKDSFNGRIFSMLHEFVHILLGQGGISNTSYYEETDEKIEIFCNKLAAEILVPSSYILAHQNIKSGKHESIFKTKRKNLINLIYFDSFKKCKNINKP